MRKTFLAFFAVLLFLVTGALACSRVDTGSPEYRLELVKEIKAFEKELGFGKTDNFGGYSKDTEAYDYYFYTLNTELPYAMGDPLLQFGVGAADNITLDRSQYDIFTYSIQAIAGVQTPITRSLMEAPLDRFIHVILHEDWHEQVKNLPLSLAEPSAEVISYGAALEFSRQKFGARSEVYKNLNDELNKKLRESVVYVEYYAKLADLYSRYQAGVLGEKETLEEKKDLIGSMANDLKSIWGRPPDQLNNALIAFQMTYLRHFPLMYRVYAAAGNDLARSVRTFRDMPGQGEAPQNLDEIKSRESLAVDYFEDFLKKAAPGKTASAPASRTFPKLLTVELAITGSADWRLVKSDGAEGGI